VYYVTFSRSHYLAEPIGQFDTIEEAIAAAYEAGAIDNDNRMEKFARNSQRDICLDVSGHEGDETCAIWIETWPNGSR
jgi:hypothetical protein